MGAREAGGPRRIQEATASVHQKVTSKWELVGRDPWTRCIWLSEWRRSRLLGTQTSRPSLSLADQTGITGSGEHGSQPWTDGPGGGRELADGRQSSTEVCYNPGCQVLEAELRKAAGSGAVRKAPCSQRELKSHPLCGEAADPPSAVPDTPESRAALVQALQRMEFVLGRTGEETRV